MDQLVVKLEREAYYNVLRAFRIQSSDLSWEKEAVLTSLRQQLRISNDVHGELLRILNSDDVMQNAIGQGDNHASLQHARPNLPPRPLRTRKISELYLREDTRVQGIQPGGPGHCNDIPVAGRISRHDNVEDTRGEGKTAEQEIALMDTDKLVDEVGRTLASSPPNSLDLERAKKMLIEQEKDLVDSIACLAGNSDDRKISD